MLNQFFETSKLFMITYKHYCVGLILLAPCRRMKYSITCSWRFFWALWQYLEGTLNFCAICRLGQATQVAVNGKTNPTNANNTKSLASFAQDYRKLAIDCLKVLRIEMQMETIFHLQVCYFQFYMFLVREGISN